MMAHLPAILGLTLCEDVVADPQTRNISLIRSFTDLSVDSSRSLAPPFCVFAALTDGIGEAAIELGVSLLADVFEEIYRVQSRLQFSDRLQVVYYLMRLSRCPLPTEGSYLFNLRIDGQWMAQRSLRVQGPEQTP